MHTLIVSYLPRRPRSHTASLLDHFLDRSAGRGTSTHLDLLQQPPPVFDQVSIDAYVRRNYLQETVSAADQAVLAPFDALVEQLRAADILVLACPMHNFSFPGLVKSYFDAVMLKHATWTIDASGYRGLMGGRRALTLSASGGPYLDPPSPRDHLTSLARLELGFMGYDPIKTLLADGMNLDDARREASLARCRAAIDAICADWYPPA